MSTLTTFLGRVDFSAPRLTWRGLLARLVAFDTLYRERAAMADLDAQNLRDIGVTRGDIDGALRRPDAHLRLILLRRSHQFER